MVPSLLSTALLRNTLTAAACAAAFSFGFMDANPTLFWYHQLLQISPSLQTRAYQNHFANKTVWIVGASSGIGEELAYRISPVCQTLILSSRNPDLLRRVAQQCNGNNVVIVPIDVTRPSEELEQVITQQIIPELSSPCGLDCIVYNAGQGQLAPAADTDPQTTERMFQVNTLPPIILTQLLMKHGVLSPRYCELLTNNKQQKQQIVMTSSVGGRMGLPLSSSYAASKHALHGYASSLQAECSSWLRIDMLCPGTVETNFFRNQQQQPQPQQSIMNGDTASVSKTIKKSPLKMPVERCAGLMMSQMVKRKGGEAWIAQQPTLLGMYLQQYAPGLWQFALDTVGPKRMSLYEQGLDLYDPASWRRSSSVHSSKQKQPVNAQVKEKKKTVINGKQD